MTFSNSVNHEEKTKEIITLREIWKCNVNCHKIWRTFALNSPRISHASERVGTHKSLVQYHGFKTAEQSVQHLALAASISTSVISYLASFFVDDCFYNRGQTSRPVVRAQIQTSCNFEENIRNSAVFRVVSIVSSMLSLWNSVT